MPDTAQSVCTEAAALVGGDRNQTHGQDIKQSLEGIASIWSGVLKARQIAGRDPLSLDAHDVANMMEALKIGRRYSGKFNPDDYVDGAGYAGLAFVCGASQSAKSAL